MKKCLIIFSSILLLCHSFFTVECSAKSYKLSEIVNDTFETERLILTKTTADDLTFLAYYLLNKDVSRFLDFESDSGFANLDDSMQYLKSSDESKLSMRFTVILKDTQLPIGQVTANLYENEYVCIGYWIAKDFQGKKFAREAVSCFVNKILNASDVKVVSAWTDAKNVASINLMYSVLNCINHKNHITLDYNVFEEKISGKILCVLTISKNS